MRADFDCLPCFANQAYILLNEIGPTPAEKQRIFNRALDIIKSAVMGEVPARISTRLNQQIMNDTNAQDPFAEKKRLSNRVAKIFLESIDTSGFTLVDYLKLSVAGNAIDFSIFKDFDIAEVVNASIKKQFVIDDSPSFETLAHTSKTLLFLTDNAGEIVLDRPLIDYFKRTYPNLTITVAVKGSPVSNDALVSDFHEAGISGVALLTNGSCAMGTDLRTVSPEFRTIFDTADIVFSKGQANFETIEGARNNIFFLFQAKCQLVARHLGVRFTDINFIAGRYDGHH